MPRAGEDEQVEVTGLGFRLPATHEHEQTSSSISVSSSEFRSVRSSPSPPPDSDRDMRFARSASRSSSRRSPATPQDDIDSLKSVPESEHDVENLLSNGRAPMTDGEDTPGPFSMDWMNGVRASSRGSSMHEQPQFSMSVSPHDRRYTSPVAPHAVNARASSFNMTFKSSSPVSSAGSASVHTSSVDQLTASFESQIKASPIVNDLLERLSRCEYSNREIQRELGEVHRKVNLLVDRSLGPMTSEPEFKNPFALPSMNGRSLTPAGGYAPTSALIPPQTPMVKSDDITQLSQRLNSLTTSVGQLLALQTQQHMNAVTSAFTPRQGSSISRQPSIDIAPNQMVTSPPLNQASMLGHGLPNRPELRPSPRTPNPPMRTWSAGTLELPMRPSDATISRQDLMMRDKRRSVAGLMRRDSAGVSVIQMTMFHLY